jgi:outer membrane protein assembly factor BamB
VENLLVSGLHRNVVYIVTSRNNVYAFDAVTLSQIWSKVLGQNDRSIVLTPDQQVVSCNSLSPDGIGTEATPVIDRAGNRIFISYRTNQSTSVNNAHQWLQALDLATGKTISAVEVTGPGFDVTWERSRASLLLLNGVVYVAFGARCEDPGQPMFHGWVFAFDAVSLKQLGRFAVTPPSIDGGGVWQTSSGLAADNDSIYLMTGNRRPDADHQPLDTSNLADSFIRLQPSITRDSNNAIAEVNLTECEATRRLCSWQGWGDLRHLGGE